MFGTLVRGAVRHAKAVIGVAVLVLVTAGMALERLSVDVFPDLESTRVTVLTEAPGFAVDEVERLVTMPLERALLGTRGVERIRATSIAGISLLYVDYGESVATDRARQRVAERISVAAADLPPDVIPTLGPEASLTGEVVQVAVYAGDDGPGDLALRAWTEFELRPRLLAVAGVAQVSVMGGRLPELTVAARQDALRGFGLSWSDVVRAAGDAHSTLAAGYLPDEAGRELELRQSARVEVAGDLAAAIVRDDGARPVRLGEVAEIVETGAPRRGSAGLADGSGSGVRPTVMLSVTKAPGTNTLAVTSEIDRVLDTATAPAGVEMDARFARHASFIERAVARVKTVGVEAAVVVALVLLLFLFNLRTAAIAICAIPLSLGITVLWLGGGGGGLDVMTLGGMAIAIGVLVDDAIIDVENVLRRLRQNAAKPEAERSATEDVVVAATAEIRPAMVQATLILALSFVPFLFLGGLEGRFFRPLGLTFIVALFASLGVALTVTPALCRLLLGGTKGLGKGGHGALARALLAAYRPVLSAALRLRFLVLLGAAALIAVTVMAGSHLGTAFLPKFHEGMPTVFIYAPPGTSLAETESIANAIVGRVAQVDGVSAAARRTGRAERDEHVEPVWNSEVEVVLDDPLDAAAVTDRISAVLDGFPGVTTSLGQPIEHRLSHVLSGTPSDLAVELYHEDPDSLAAATAAVSARLSGVPGARDVNAQRTLTVEGLSVRWDRDALARVGATVADMASQLQVAFQGVFVGEVVDGMARKSIVVRAAADERRSADDVRRLELVTPRGARVRASELATIELEDVPTMRLRQDGRRKSVVTCNVAAGTNLGDLVAAATEALSPVAASWGAELRFGGRHEAATRGRRTLLASGLFAALLGIFLLRSTVKSWAGALVVAINLPLATVGGVAALYLAVPAPLENLTRLLRGDPGFIAPVVSLSTLVGFATLFGIALRGGVLLAGRWETLMSEGTPLKEAIHQGAEDRLVPILMTAITAALGLVPVALASGQPGTELLAPLAIVVLGGLVTSTTLNLLVLPAAYGLLRRR